MAASTPAEKFAYNVSEQLERARAMVGESLRLLQTIDPDSQHPGLSDQDPKVAPIDHLTRVVASALAGLFDAHRAEDLSSARQSIRRSMATLGQALVLSQPLRATFPAVDSAARTMVDSIGTLKDLAPRTSSMPPPPRARPSHESYEPVSQASSPNAPLAHRASVLPARDPTAVTINAELSATSESNFYAGFSGDIADGGCFVATYEHPPCGTPVVLTIALPGNFQLQLQGSVQFVVDATHAEDGDLRPGVGIKFTHLSQSERDMIHRFIRHRAPMFFDD